MTRIRLATDGANAQLESLSQTGDTPLDLIKVGSWMDDSRVPWGHPLLLHVAEGVAWPRSDRWIAAQIERTRRLGSPWVSTHLELGSAVLNNAGLLLPLVPPSVAKLWAVSTLRRWGAQSPVPLLVENMPRSRHKGHAYLVNPAFITRVVEEADCHLLLDLAHARVSAAMLGQPIRTYIQRLPIDRLREIHVSGPRPFRRRHRPAHSRRITNPCLLVDAHESLQEEDWELLAWVLRQARPQAVTLEYWGDRARLREQLRNLRRLLDGS